jgi:hypothetical protein
MSTTYRTENRVHPWTVEEFQKDRKEQFDCATQIVTALEYNSNVLVTAPVKSGKRQIAEIVAMIYGNREGANNRHCFITALNRIDTKNQIEELSKYNLDVVVLAKTKDRRNLKQKLDLASDPNNIIVHFDESDYGTGIKNLFRDVFDVCKKRKIKLVCYSATNEEAAKSGFADVAKTIKMVPNELYKGAEWFLDNDLVHDPQPFFDGKDITPHGEVITNDWLTSNKPLAILRLAGGEKDNGLYSAFKSSSAQAWLTQHKIRVECIDGNNPFDWMSEYERLVSDFQKLQVRTLLVINQTCSRSTELGFHKHLEFLHDYRNGESNYGTLAQAYLRVAHYHPEGHRIHVYGNKDVFELAAGRISHEDYNGKLGARISKQTTKAGNALAQSEEHWYTPEEKLDISGMSLEKQEAEIREIWNRQIQLAIDNFNYNKDSEGKEKRTRKEVDKRLKFELDESGTRWKAPKYPALGRGTLDNVTTTKRHIFTYKNDTEIIVRSVFHDGTKEDVEESTTHSTSQNSVFQT